MSNEKKIDIQNFARRVEDLCSFLLERIPSNSENIEDLHDLKIIQDLKQDAADLQFSDFQMTVNVLDGLAEFVSKS